MSVTLNSCEHVFDISEDFCTKCSIEFGDVCFRPGCPVVGCKKHKLLFYPCLETSYGDVVGFMNDEIVLLHLGHDGVTWGEDADVRKVLSFKGLKRVEYCGYYSNENVTNVFKEKAYSHITFVPIW